MNAKRRQKIRDAVHLLRRASEIIEGCAAAERDAFDNLPEGLQASERGDALELMADDLEERFCEIDGMIEDLDRIVEGEI